MFNLLFFILSSLPIKGDLPVGIDYSYYLSNGNPHLEIFYEIPCSSLIFIREGNNFIARYEINIFALSPKRDFILLDKVVKEVKRKTDEESEKENREEGKLVFSPPPNSKSILLLFQCRNSQRAAEVSFPLKEKKEIFLRKGKDVIFSKKLSWDDTLSLYFPPDPKVTSYEVSLKRGKKEVFKRVIPGGEGFFEPLRNFPAILSDTSGIYKIKIYARGKEEVIWEKEMSIHITVSPFLSDKEWQRRISLLFPIATEEEIKELKVTPTERRSATWEEFWGKKEIKEEDYFSRVEYCLKNFSFGDKGLASDRAKIYLKYGQPDAIEEYPYETNKKPYIIWYYYNLGLNFIFVDQKGIGEYVLVR
ncbi:MAG: GWxTD domain-containing protein [candidate division WOR-3 bacterium]